MNVKPALVLDISDSLSKALDELMENGTAVIITKNKSYFGIVDDRNLREGIGDPSKVKCESLAVKAPVLNPNSSLEERLNAFMAGHFKALPVISSSGKPTGIYTRADLLAELLTLKVIPKDYVRNLMNFPVFTVQHDDKVSTAKNIMKEKNHSRLVVIRKGKPVGLISTHDFAIHLIKPQAKEGKSIISQVNTPNEMQVYNFMRDVIPSVSEDSLLEDAMKKMALGNFSSVLVLSGNEPKGVLSATDIFRKVLQLSSSEVSIIISGLSDDDLKHQEYVKSAILGAIAKFAKSFEIADLNVHFKKGKSVYNAKLHMKLDNSPLVISAEDYTLREVVDALVKESHNVLTKRKSKFVDKKMK